VAEQLEKAKARVAAKNKGGKYLAYFQSFTGTYAPLPRLEGLYRAALAPEDIVGISIGTRPDCLPQETVALLAELNKEKPVFVELGLQTIHEATARYIRRGYETAVYYDAVRRLQAAGIHTVTHIILGLPGETPALAAETTRAAIAAGTEGVKFHLLHVLRNTDLEKDYQAGKFETLTLPEYTHWLDLCLSELKPETVIHRLTGDGHKRDLIAPLWSADKKKVLNYLNQNLHP
jgi:radical SAM protein (TIGR01212 family)